MPVDAEVLAGIELFYLLPAVRFFSQSIPILKFRLSKLLKHCRKGIKENWTCNGKE